MKPEQAAEAVREEVEKKKKSINRQVKSRGKRVANALRSAELETFTGVRSGRIYKKPGTHGGATKSTRKLMKEYNHKLRKGGQLYRASAPGEVPASRRRGGLRAAVLTAEALLLLPILRAGRLMPGILNTVQKG